MGYAAGVKTRSATATGLALVFVIIAALTSAALQADNAAAPPPYRDAKLSQSTPAWPTCSAA